MCAHSPHNSPGGDVLDARILPVIRINRDAKVLSLKHPQILTDASQWAAPAPPDTWQLFLIVRIV